MKLALYLLIAGLGVISAVFLLLPGAPSFQPCATFRTMFGGDSIIFPLEGRDAKYKLGGLRFDPANPFFWFKERGDTTIRLRIHKGHEADRFTYHGKDNSFSLENDKLVENHDLKGIYSYLFYFPVSTYLTTLSDAEKQYGPGWKQKTSFNSKIPYRIWKIGPCHHLLVYRKKRYQMVDETPDEKEYTYVMFIYNLAAEEADDAVELDGGIRNDFRSLSEIR